MFESHRGRCHKPQPDWDLGTACAHNPEGLLAFQTKEGTLVERVESGVLALDTITDASVKVHLPSAMDWQMADEFSALVVRQIVITAGMVDLLEAALEQSA